MSLIKDRSIFDINELLRRINYYGSGIERCNGIIGVHNVLIDLVKNSFAQQRIAEYVNELKESGKGEKQYKDEIFDDLKNVARSQKFLFDLYKSEVGRTKPWCMFWGIVDAALSVGCIVSSVVLAVSTGRNSNTYCTWYWLLNYVK